MITLSFLIVYIFLSNMLINILLFSLEINKAYCCIGGWIGEVEEIIHRVRVFRGRLVSRGLISRIGRARIGIRSRLFILGMDYGCHLACIITNHIQFIC